MPAAFKTTTANETDHS